LSISVPTFRDRSLRPSGERAYEQRIADAGARKF
jgi:hypothetical protein